jgi:hypothetical protein
MIQTVVVLFRHKKKDNTKVSVCVSHPTRVNRETTQNVSGNDKYSTVQNPVAYTTDSQRRGSVPLIPKLISE